MPRPSDSRPERMHVRALDDHALGMARRLVWAMCIAIYLTVFIGGIQAGGAELTTLARASGFTLLAAVLGRCALGLLAGATLPLEAGPMDTQEGTLGSLIDFVASANVGHHADEAEAA